MEPLIPKNLCTRCGACFAADTKNFLAEDEKGFPILRKRNVDEERRLKRVCTGHNWNYRELLDYVHGSEHPYDPSSPDAGKIRQVRIAWASDPTLRSRGQSGGISISLLRAGFELDAIDSALAVARRRRSDGYNPFAAIPFIARTESDLIEAAGSKYAICPSLKLIREIHDKSERFAATLLPCQTAGLYQLMRTELPNLSEKLKFIIGPFCGLNLEWEVGVALARAAGLDPREVDEFANRAGRFPGETRFVMRNGQVHMVDRTAHRVLYRTHSPVRCYTCTDYGNELADITIADAFLKNEKREWKYPEGAGYLVARTDRGQSFIDDACEAGILESEPIDEEWFNERWAPSFEHRKTRSHNRIHLLSKCGEVPKLDYSLPLFDRRFAYADTLELLLVRVFHNDFVRDNFLRWWLRSASPGATKIEKWLYRFLKGRVFTHRADDLISPSLFFKRITSKLKSLRSH